MKFKATIIILLILAAAGAIGQQSGQPQPLPPFSIPDCAKGDRLCEEQKYKRDKARNEERQADLKRDTDKLYQLATELKEAVDKSNENTLSLDVIRKTEEIEKLAKNVRNKMKGQ
jgi:hypothetical protein